MVKNWFSVVHVYLFDPECKSFNEIPKETPYFTTTNDCWKWGNLWLNKQSSSPHLSIKHQQLLNCVFDFQQKSSTCTIHTVELLRCSKGVQLHYQGHCIEKEIRYLTILHHYLFFIKKMTKKSFIYHTFI